MITGKMKTRETGKGKRITQDTHLWDLWQTSIDLDHSQAHTSYYNTLAVTVQIYWRRAY